MVKILKGIVKIQFAIQFVKRFFKLNIYLNNFQLIFICNKKTSNTNMDIYNSDKSKYFI